MPTSLNLPSKIDKASQVVMAYSDGAEFTLLDRKVFNVLYANAWRALRMKSTEHTHKINLSDLKAAVLGPHDDIKMIRESLERLWSVKISVEYADENGVGHSLRCHYLSFSTSGIEGSTLSYSFDEMLLKFIANKQVYSTVELKVANSMGSLYGNRLYEVMSMYQRMYKPVWEVPIDALREFFEVGDNHPRTDNFRKHVIERAVEDVNLNAPFTVLPEYRREGQGGKISSVAFRVVPKLAGEFAGIGVKQSKGKDDRFTIDMFDGTTEADRMIPPELRSDTVQEAERIMGPGADIVSLRDEWFAAYGKRTHNSPDEMFLAWVRVQADKRRSESLKDVDLDSFLDNILGGNN